MGLAGAVYTLVRRIQVNPSGAYRIETAVVGAVAPVAGKENRVAVIVNAVALVVTIAYNRQIGSVFNRDKAVIAPKVILGKRGEPHKNKKRQEKFPHKKRCEVKQKEAQVSVVVGKCQ